MAVSVRNGGERSGYAPSDKAGIEGPVASTNYRSDEPRHERADVATHLERHFSSQVPVDEADVPHGATEVTALKKPLELTDLPFALTIGVGTREVED